MDKNEQIELIEFITLTQEEDSFTDHESSKFCLMRVTTSYKDDDDGLIVSIYDNYIQLGSGNQQRPVFLKKDGFTIDDFNRVHNPIGLEIGAETPEEIAISIAAELIKVRRERMK